MRGEGTAMSTASSNLWSLLWGTAVTKEQWDDRVDFEGSAVPRMREVMKKVW